jgi:TonB family protein
MKKAHLLSIVCFTFACIAGVGYFTYPSIAERSKSRPVAAKQTKSAKASPKNSWSNAIANTSDNKKPQITQEQLNEIGQALHERREKALKTGDHRALVALGKEVRDTAAFPGYKKLAAMCFADAAKLGSNEGMMLAGWCANKGFGMERNVKRAFDYYFEAAEAGLVEGYTTAARMVLSGNNEAGDLDTANALIEKAIAMGSAEAKFLKGTLLLADESATQAGLAYLTEAAQADYADAQRLLGLLYKEGKYVPKDMAAAAEWAKLAAGTHLTSANIDYAALAMYKISGTEGGAKAGMELLKQAADQNNVDAAYTLAMLYRGATGVSIQDVEKTRAYATIAYEGGEPKAAFLMAATYSQDDNGTILEWLKKGDKEAEWRSRYATRLVKYESITPYDAVQLAMKATIEEARNYGSLHVKNLMAGRIPPQIVTMVQPQMPATLNAIDVYSEVKVQFLVNEDGVPTNLQVVLPSPYDDLNKAAMNAIAHWRYKPAVRDGVIVPSRVTTPVRFRSRR